MGNKKVVAFSALSILSLILTWLFTFMLSPNFEKGFNDWFNFFLEQEAWIKNTSIGLLLFLSGYCFYAVIMLPEKYTIKPLDYIIFFATFIGGLFSIAICLGVFMSA